MVQVATVGAVQVDQQQKTSDFVRISHELGHVDLDVGEAVHVQPMMIILVFYLSMCSLTCFVHTVNFGIKNGFQTKSRNLEDL